MAMDASSQGSTVAAANVFPWRRGQDKTPSKTLSVEAPEFIPRWKEQEHSCSTPALDGNCHMISLGAYSDDSDDDDDIVSQTPVTTSGGAASDSKTASGESVSFRFRRPWRVAAAEFVPQGVEAKTASSSNDTPAETKRFGSREVEAKTPSTFKEAAADIKRKSIGGERPWAKRSGSKDQDTATSNKQLETIGSRAPSTKQPATNGSSAPWKKKVGTVVTPPPENRSDSIDVSPLSISTLSTSASSTGMDSTSAGSSCSNRSRSETPREEAEVAQLHPSDLLRWRHASFCERPAAIVTFAATIDLAETSEEPQVQAEKPKERAQALDMKTLLQWRKASPSERPSAVVTSAVEIEPGSPEEALLAQIADESPSSEAPAPVSSPTPLCQSLSKESKAEPVSTKEEKCWRNVDRVPKLKVSEDSWAAKQRARRASSGESETTDEEVVRAMRTILNKLTLEKFDSLSQQLIHCGIRTSVHLELLIQEVFEKATTQHHFIDMYANLCGLLHGHFSNHPLVDDPKMNFKKILLNCCQTSFEKHLVPPEGLEKLSNEDRTVQEQLYKTRMLGNIRFVGSLLVRKMLASKVMLAIMEELLQDPTPEALESLAALLTVVGPSFDQPDWAYRTTLNAIFTQVDKLSKKTTVPQRVRCLLKDVSDIRKANWHDRRPKKIEGPKTLNEVAVEAGMSTKAPDASNEWAVVGGPRLAKLAAVLPSKPISTSSPVSAATGKQQQSPPQKPEKTVKNTTSGQNMLQFLKNRDHAEPKKEAARFDLDACKAEVSATLSELRVSHDVSDAVARIAAIAVPVSQQPIEFGEILCRLVDEGAPESRKVGFQLLAGLFLEGHWKPESLAKGLRAFVEESYSELQCDIPLLPRIMREELHPSFKPLVKAKFLGAEQHDSLISGL